jgi:transposase
MRSIGLDVHQSFCEVAICEAGEVRSAGRIQTDREELELFARSLGAEDQVVLEATGPAMEIARILGPHVARVVVANAQEVRAISHARVKSDRFDARTLAHLLHAGMLDAVWVPDLFGVGGRRWLTAQKLPETEVETVAGCLHQIDFLDVEISKIDRRLGEWAVGSAEARRLMTIPGVGVAAAAALMAAIGDISRFDSSRRLVAYLGLDPKVRQSGEEPACHGRISKRGNAQARAVLVEAAWSAVRSPGPLRVFGERVRVRKGSQVAAVAVARKIACLCWQLLTKEEDYAYARPSLLRAKIRRAELDAGAPPRSKRHGGKAVSASDKERQAERELVERAEVAYRRLVADWKATGAKGAGATTGRASSGPSAGQAARQDSAPEPAL